MQGNVKDVTIQLLDYILYLLDMGKTMWSCWRFENMY